MEPPRLLRADPACVRERFNLAPFRFAHALASHPLFELERLGRLAAAMVRSGARHRLAHAPAAGVSASTKFSTTLADQDIVEAILSVRSGDSWIKLTGVQDFDPDYRALVESVLGELEQAAGAPLRSQMSFCAATIFIASPGAVTPYHIDHEPTFLFQLQGSKEVNVFDGRDRSIVTELELERFYAGDIWAARYRPESQVKASVHALQPGDGVHHPPLAPHWVRSGPQGSVGMSLSPSLRPLDRLARPYQVNHYLRRLGLEPTPPGKSPWKDALKMAALGIISKRKAETDREAYGSGIDRIRAAAAFLKGLGPPWAS
jgi:hypothetical protein